MSIVIALKFSNGVLLASDRQVTRYGKSIKDSCNKIFRVENNSRIAIGGVGKLRELQRMKKISRNLFSEISELSENSCVQLVNRLTLEYRNNLFIEPNEIIEMLDNEFIFADAYNINYICQDLSVVSNLDYFAIGCGEDLVMGHLKVALENKNINELDISNAEKLLEDSIKIACKEDCYIDDNIDYIVLHKNPSDIVEDSVYELIDKCEFEILNKNKPKSECNKKCNTCLHKIRIIYNKKKKTIQAICNPY